MSIYVARPALMYDDHFNFREVFAVEAMSSGRYVQYAGIQRMRLEPHGQAILKLPKHIEPASSTLVVEEMNSLVRGLEDDGWTRLF